MRERTKKQLIVTRDVDDPTNFKVEVFDAKSGETRLAEEVKPPLDVTLKDITPTVILKTNPLK